jgi:hypothetical protein
MRQRARVRVGLLCIAAMICFLGASSAASAVTFGIGDFGLAAYGDSASFHTLCGWTGASCGHGGLNIRDARLNVPYDSLATYDSASGSCVNTSTDPNNWVLYNGVQTPTGQALQSWLAEAQQDGLRPLFAVSSAVSNLTATEPANNPRLPTGNDYLCGLEGLMKAAGPEWNLWVHDWEVFNEPEQGLCASTAASFLSLAKQAATQEGRSSDTLVAGAFSNGDDPVDGSNHPDCGHPSGDWFIHDYVQKIVSLGLDPSAWSWHPYNDVDAGYTGTSSWHQTGDLVSYLNRQFPSDPSFWVTEAGVVLNSAQYGSYVDGSPIGQANAAQAFKNLGNAPGQAYSGQISRIYWYEFQTYGDGSSVGSDTWDSALLGLARPDWVEDGSGVPRASYCVLAYADSPIRAVNDSRCDYISSPNVPWSDWEDPNG